MQHLKPILLLLLLTLNLTANTIDGREEIIKDKLGRSSIFVYDAVDNQIKVIDALENETIFSYDAQGNRVSVTNALGQTTTYEYNALNQNTKTIYPDGTSTQTLNNISGLPTKKIDENANETSYSYDTTKTIPLLNQVTLHNGAITSYTYDSQGKKVAQTDALNRTTSWNYTDIGELGSETLPLGQTKTISYDVYGKQTQINDYQNKAIKFIYDSNDKLVRTEYADGSTITYDYTPSGRLKSQTDAQGTITNSYDSMGRLTAQTNAKGETIAYEYDGVGNIVEIVTPTQTISKSYTVRNRLASVTDSTGTTSYSYDEIGRQSSISYPNGVTTDYSYDSRNRITSIVHKDSSDTILQSFTYTLDDIGNRVEIIEKSGRATNYEYNSVNQLTKEIVSNDLNNQNTITSYNYDEVGNLKTKTVDNTTTTYNYNANDQLIQQDSITFTYDNNGNLIAKDGTTYEYDDKNRLIKTQTQSNTIEYSYDANNNRIAKTINGDTTSYLIDTNTPYAQVITESKTDGTTVEYSYGNDLINNGSRFFLTDALGSTRGLVDSGEKLTDSYNYTPYGTITEHNGTNDNSFLFTGEQRDSESDNYYLRARYYSPSSSRFISRDSYDGTAMSPVTQNHYLYGNGNPVMFTDPSGFSPTYMAINRITILGTESGLRTMNLQWINGQGSLIIKSLACELGVSYAKKQFKGDGNAGHHTIPKNVGGHPDPDKQALLFLPAQTHRAFHYIFDILFKTIGPEHFDSRNNYSSKANWDTISQTREGRRKLYIVILASSYVIDKVCKLRKPRRLQDYVKRYKNNFIGDNW